MNKTHTAPERRGKRRRRVRIGAAAILVRTPALLNHRPASIDPLILPLGNSAPTLTRPIPPLLPRDTQSIISCALGYGYLARENDGGAGLENGVKGRHERTPREVPSRSRTTTPSTKSRAVDVHDPTVNFGLDFDENADPPNAPPPPLIPTLATTTTTVRRSPPVPKRATVDEDQGKYKFEVLPPPVVDGSVTNMQEVDPSKQDHPKWMRDMWSEKVQAVDKNVIDKELEARLESRPPELDHVQPGEELFVTFGTASVTDFVQNWLESADKLGLSPLFVGALDEDMYEWCKKRGVPSMLLKGNTVLKNRGQQFITAGDKSFKKMGTVKTKFIQDLLELGIAPILTDADVVWLKDPRSYFKRGTYITADVLVSTDCIDVPADRKDNNGCSHVNFNTGVLHFRPTDAAKAFVQTWKTKVATSTIAWMRDQPAFNLITHEGVGGHSLEPAVSVPEERRGTEGHRMVYWAANASIRLGVLPNWLFGNGHSYFVQWHHLKHPEDGEPFSVHLTYQYGDTGSYAFGKRERMRQAGIWRSDPREYFEDGKYLVVSDEGSQVDFSGESPGGEEVGSDRNAYRTAIDRHLREDKLRRTTIRNALALARALNRILVLPEARCYCDKIWNNLNACRAPGAESFKLPYACPMDHIYDLPSWFNPGMPDFREPGFLDDPRVPDAIKASVGRVVVDRDGDTRAGKPGWDMNDGKVVKLRHGFTVPDAKLALKSLEEKRVIEVDFLGNEGTFCGFGDDAKNKEFDRIVVKPLSASQYYCFTELWEDQGSPRGGRNGPYEPQVVLRHCGMMEDDFKRAGKVHAGVVEHIDKPDGGCSCEWGFGLPRGLAHISKDESICPRRNSDQPTAG